MGVDSWLYMLLRLFAFAPGVLCAFGRSAGRKKGFFHLTSARRRFASSGAAFAEKRKQAFFSPLTCARSLAG